MCIWIWSWADFQKTLVFSEGGTWDLRGYDFSKNYFNLIGDVEYIPRVLLTPRQFEERQDEIMIGSPEKVASFSTSRIRILVPVGTYSLMGYSSEYASRVYINDILSKSIGVPGSASDDSKPGSCCFTPPRLRPA